MADNGDTGAGTTITFGTTGFSASFTQIETGGETRAVLEDTHLGSSTRTYMPGDLKDSKPLTGTFYWDQSASTFPVTTTEPETVTVTFPLKSGESTNATLAGTAIVDDTGGPTAQVGSLMMGTISVRWDNKTFPTYTAGS